MTYRQRLDQARDRAERAEATFNREVEEVHRLEDALGRAKARLRQAAAEHTRAEKAYDRLSDPDDEELPVDLLIQIELVDA